MFARLAACGFGILIVLSILALVVAQSKGAKTMLYEDLTCSQLIAGYEFNVNVLHDMVEYYNGCLDFADSPANTDPHAKLRCEFIKEHGIFVQGIANDLAAVFNAKPECTNSERQ
jgi:hypothetical protein